MSTNVSWERIYVTGMRFVRTMLVCTTALAWMDILEMALTVEVTQLFMTSNNSDLSGFFLLFCFVFFFFLRCLFV